MKIEAEEGREIYPLKMAGNLEERYHSNKCLIETRSLLPPSCFLSLLPNQFTMLSRNTAGREGGETKGKEREPHILLFGASLLTSFFPPS